jgi:5-methylcytosine-specific restriction endonuclease McrA
MRCEWENRRRARLKGAGRIEKINRIAVFERDGGVCGICNSPVPREKFEVDHIRPIARGGTHSWDNVQLAHPSCNRKKYVKVLA